MGVRRAAGWALVTVRRDGNGAPTSLLETTHRAYPNAWSPDGRTLVYQERRPETGWDLMAVDVGPTGVPSPPRALVATPFQEENASVSKDGRASPEVPYQRPVIVLNWWDELKHVAE